MEKYLQMKDGKKIAKERNFYPGYVLIEAIMDAELQHIIKNINSVIGFLGDKSGTPVPMRQAEVNRILGKVDEMASQSEVININYMVGEQVKVMDGPFQGFSGIIEEVNDEKKKLKVMVKIFGRRTPLELNYMQVEKE
jgi:transcriptional antiterminator NusG